MGPEPISNDAPADTGFDFAALPAAVRRPRISGWPNRRCLFAAVLGTLLLHGYALTILPSALDYLPWYDEFVLEINLTNDEIGEPDVITNYNVDRIEEVTVPGPIDPDREVGLILPSLEGNAIPPLPGFANQQHQGGFPATDDRGPLIGKPLECRNHPGVGGGPDAPGLGWLLPQIKVVNPALHPVGFAGASGATTDVAFLREGGGTVRSRGAGIVQAARPSVAASLAPTPPATAARPSPVRVALGCLR